MAVYMQTATIFYIVILLETKIRINQAYNCQTSRFVKSWIPNLLRSFSALITKTIDIMYKGIKDYVSE